MDDFSRAFARAFGTLEAAVSLFLGGAIDKERLAWYQHVAVPAIERNEIQSAGQHPEFEHGGEVKH